MAEAKPAKKTPPPAAEEPARETPRETPREVEAAGRETAGRAGKKAPHEALWEAGQSLCQTLKKADEEARGRLAAAWQEQQQHLWKVQLDVQRRAEELRQEYWNTLNQAAEENRGQAYDAAQKYMEGLWGLQAEVRKEWEAAGASQQRLLTNLQAVFQGSRLTAFRDYKQACQKALRDLDADGLSCESLAAIGQNLWMSAQLMGAR